MTTLCISIFNHLIRCIQKQNTPQDAAWKALQFIKNSLFYISNKKKGISLHIEKDVFFEATKIGCTGFYFSLKTRSKQLK